MHANPEPSTANRTAYYVESAIACPVPIAKLAHFTVHIYCLHTIHVGCFRRFVPQPECNHGAIHAMVKKVHGCGVATDMRADLLPFEGRATRRGQMGVFGQETLDRITAKSAAADAGKDWIFGLTVALP